MGSRLPKRVTTPPRADLVVSSLESSARQSYQRIFRSSSIMGLVSLVEMAAGLVRTKCAALFVGVHGVGLLANLTSIQGLVGSFASWGIPMSGMREIALAQNNGDQIDVAQKVCAMLRWCWISAIGGGLIILVFAAALSSWVLGDASHTRDVLWLSLVVLCGRLAAGYTSVLQSLNRIRYLALLSTVNAVGSSLMAAILYWSMGIEGVALSMVCAFVLQVLVCRWFYGQLKLPRVSQSWAQTRELGLPMIRLGTAFMWNGLLLCLVGFGTNAMLTRYGGLGSVGIFNAALSLATVLVNFVLNAMSVDYAPRLASLGNDKPAMNGLINQQMELGLLVSLPLIGLAMVFAVPLIHLLYTREFVAAAEILRWLLLGNLLKIVAWPLAFVIPSLGKGRLYFVVETSFNLAYLASIPLMVQIAGVAGVAYAYLMMYLLYALMSYRLAYKYTGFLLNATTQALLLRGLATPVALLLLGIALPLYWALGIGLCIWLGLAIYCGRGLVNRVGVESRVVRLLLTIPGMKMLLGAGEKSR
jgi:enterobacterial common antigen flippase